ncbi:MAG: transcription antitermination protein NusB [Bacilli bacterium]|jgi:transcription antitermination factor NusB
MEAMSTDEKTLTRNQMHEKLMICTYQYLFYMIANDEQTLDAIIDSVFGFEEPKYVDPFIREGFLAIITYYLEAIDKLEPLLINWRFERLDLIEQAILILGYIEYKYLEIPKPVMINICVKLAQKYANDESYKFINAILEKI